MINIRNLKKKKLPVKKRIISWSGCIAFGVPHTQANMKRYIHGTDSTSLEMMVEAMEIEESNTSKSNLTNKEI